MALPDYIGTVVSQGGRPTTEAEKILVLGQKQSTGTAAINEVISDIDNFDEIDTLFGKQSQLTAALRSALFLKQKFRSPENPRIDVIVVDDPMGGLAAEGKVFFAGAATEDGSLTFRVASSKNHTFEIPVDQLDTGAEIADKLEILLNADERLPVTLINDAAGTVDLTAIEPSVLGNDMLIEIIGSVAGIAVTLIKFENGSGQPDLTTALQEVENIRYQTIVTSGLYDRQELDDFLEPRFNTGSFTLLDGVAILFNTGTFANVIDLVDPIVGLNNSRNLVTEFNRLIDEIDYKGGYIRELDLVNAMQVGYIRAFRHTEGAFTQDVISTGIQSSLDRRGGPALASLPYFNTRGFNLPVIDIKFLPTDAERVEASKRGLSIISNNDQQSELILFSTVTSYKKDSQGFDDETFKFLNFVDTEVTIREIFKVRLQSAFPQSRLTEGVGDVVVGRNVATEKAIRTAVVKIYGQLASAELALVDNSDSLYAVFKDSLIVVIERAKRKATVSMVTPIMSQLEIIDMTFEINLTS